MSFQPPFANANNAIPSFNSNKIGNTGIVPQTNSGAFQRSTENNFPNCNYVNSSNMNRYHLSTSSYLNTTRDENITNHGYNNASLPRHPFNAPPLSHQNFLSTRPPNLVNFTSQHASVNPSNPSSNQQSHYRNTVPPINANFNNASLSFDPRNTPIQPLPPPPIPNIMVNTLSSNINYPRFQNNPGNAPLSISSSSLPQLPVSVNQNKSSVFNSTTSYTAVSVTNSAPPPVICTNPPIVRSSVINPPQDCSANLHTNSTLQVPLQLPLNNTSEPQNSTISFNPSHDKETKIAAFLARFSSKKKENRHQVTIPEFRCIMKAAVCMLKLLKERKNKLSKLLDASESEWKSEIGNTLKEKEELSTLCSIISAPDHLNKTVEKLKLIKKRRERKKKTKQNKLAEKMRADQKRKERDQEIDKWLDDIKEKNEKLKREEELKKEADFILLEVRRKIYEAKKTIEKIKVFEKLRIARQANAERKGLHVLSMHNLKFEKKMSVLKETMMKQLVDYEAEEKALKVMLETEQEGQREEEAQWKIEKMKSLLQKKQNNIMECLFGISDDPSPSDPLYLFHKYHTSATSSIENLVQIRQQWDIHIAEDGEVIPQHWVVPVAPSSATWKECLLTSTVTNYYFK